MHNAKSLLDAVDAFSSLPQDEGDFFNGVYASQLVKLTGGGLAKWLDVNRSTDSGMYAGVYLLGTSLHKHANARAVTKGRV